MAARRTCAPARASVRLALDQLNPTPAVVVPIVKGRGYCCYCKSPKHRTSRCATVIKPITPSSSASRSSHTIAAAASYSTTTTPPSLTAVASLTSSSSSALRATVRNGQAQLRSTFTRSASLLSASSSTPRPAPLSYNNTITSSRRSFTTSSVNMVAQKIDGNAIAKEIREGLHAQIDEKRQNNPRFNPSLKIIQGT